MINLPVSRYAILVYSGAKGLGFIDLKRRENRKGWSGS